MNKRTKNIILLVVIGQILLTAGLLALPTAVQALPGRYRVALQERVPFLGNIVEGVIEQVAPMATALPAPNQGASAPQIDISVPIDAEPTRAKPTATATAVPATSSLADNNAPQPTATPLPPTPTLEPPPVRAMIPGVTPVKQTFNNCGPANLTQVLNFWGDDITQEEVASYLKPTSEDRNVTAWQIADYVNEQTYGQFKAISRSAGTFEMIKRFIAAGYPVVIEKGYDVAGQGWYGHYLTVFGYDDTLGEMYSQDTYLGPFDGNGRTDKYEAVDKYWQQFNYTFYVVYPAQKEAEVIALLGDVMADDFTMWNRVAELAQQEQLENPNDAFALFNYGTAQTRLGGLTGEQQYYQAGAAAYDKAFAMGLPPRMLWYQFQPYLAYIKTDRYDDVLLLANATLQDQGGRNVEETYYYKAYALTSLGDLYSAREALQSALAINHNYYPAKWLLDWVNKELGIPSTTATPTPTGEAAATESSG
ncbi:MAG: C39 family peptidase [Ardenticatenaceae bacterium]|nr:C39 family peptidase [Ardenticatenaceae bacterium]